MDKMKLIVACFTIGIQSLLAQKEYYSGVDKPNNAPIKSDSQYRNSLLAIDTPEMKEILFALASDSFGGRELGSAGIELAADFICSKLNSYGIQKIGENNSYIQKVGFTWLSWRTNEVRIDDHQYRQLWDYLALPRENQSIKISSNEISFLGYGIDDEKYSDYAKQKVEGKVILIYNGEPKTKKGTFWLSKSEDPSDWTKQWDKKLQAIYKYKPKLVLVIDDQLKMRIDKFRPQVVSPTVLLDSEAEQSHASNVIFISSSMVAQLLGKEIGKLIKARDKITKTGKPQSINLKTAKLEINMKREENAVKGKNIMAFIEGSDLKNEILILSAHYDHIGKRGSEVFNGADDNGSGSTVLTQLAQALQIAKNEGRGPRRSVLCLWVTGEEKGLLGSMFYTQSPRLDLNQTILDINMDMVGRSDDKYGPSADYVYVIGADRLSHELYELNQEINDSYSKLIMDHSYNAESDPNRYYYRSDHYNFAQAGIPAIFFFNGNHEDYHRITDDPQKILFHKMQTIAKHIFRLTLKIANQDHRLKKD